MEREADLPAPPSSTNDLHRPILSKAHPSRSSISSSSSSDFLRHVQAAFKRHRPLGAMQSSSIRPTRILVPQREPLKTSTSDTGLVVGTSSSNDVVSKEGNAPHELIEQRKNIAVAAENPNDSSFALPSIMCTTTKTYNETNDPFGLQKNETNPVHDCKNDHFFPSSSVAPQHISTVEPQKKVQFYLGETANCEKMEWDASNQGEMPAVNDHELKQRDFQQTEMSDISLRSDVGIYSLLAKRNTLVQGQQHQFHELHGKDISLPMTQSSVVGSSCMTTTSIHSKSAPMLNSTTDNSRSRRDSSSHMEIEPLEGLNVKPHCTTQGDRVQPPCHTFQPTSTMLADMSSAPTQVSISGLETPVGVRGHVMSKDQQGLVLKGSDGLGSSLIEDRSAKPKEFLGDVTNVQSLAPMTANSSSDVKLESSKSVKPENAASSKRASVPRKKNYNPDLFFKVHGKLYQKLGKIGSGGSSEVYKVISSDCTVYALKRIKLKGRDYSTAYGFCQEIEYLNRLKGKNNIIQLIDYEVTDEILLAQVLNCSMNIKDGRIRDDAYIYMVLEYGEIDLAHMLSLKWKEMDSSSWNIDENWLRFYWQQILQAVNTIHEERIVHSDLKPANFLLVRGSLKLIDFGIAKAIMSDTTNIQRDSQVGTLNYMSPEAFLCNENDADGNTIKCGRPSDIWSLGCILYQMVYGRTPFSEYKTFWAKFKVITDRNHVIMYEPVSNPWLLDLMEKCLAWERNDRWRIPQLLQHPFLVPPIPSQLSSPQDHGCKLLQQISEAYGNDHKASSLCSQIQQLLTDPDPQITSRFSTLPDQHCVLLSQVTSLCSQLLRHLANLEKE